MSVNAWKLSFVIFLIYSSNLAANNQWIKDTLYVNIDETYGKYIDHQVEKKQTLFSLANAYGIDLYDVYDYNPVLKSRILLANDVLRMPLSSDHIVTDPQLLPAGQKRRPVYYIIKPKDNLYRISKIYFNVSFDELSKRNQLVNHHLKVGQKLLIGWFEPSKKSIGTPDFKPNTVKTEQTKLEESWTTANPAPFVVEYKALDLITSDWVKKYNDKENRSDKLIEIKKELKEVNIKERKNIHDKTNEESLIKDPLKGSVKNTMDNPNYTPKSEVKGKVLKRKMVTINGVAQWSKNLNASNDLYVLHPTAPINSVVEITNPMTHRKIFAKVLSNMPPKLYSDDICVVVSPGVANLLGVIDSRFYVKLRFVEESFQ